jgi:phosphoribosyl 1,2-cyclic phosphodiesterase
MLRFASLGSGSRGNCLIVDAGETRLLVDCGFPVRTTVARLARLGVAPEQIDGIVITHEHSDHVGGAFKFACRYGVPVYLTHGTQLVAARGQLCPDVRVIDSHQAFTIGGVEVQPYPVPHDAREPVQYLFSDGAWRLGVLTDIGTITPHVVAVLSRCDALVLECNHDPDLLASSLYPQHLKRRIAGNFGHLSNAQAASLLAQIETSRLQHLIAAHLSEQNNRPQLAAAALASALGCGADWIGVADQDQGFGWRACA